MKPSMAVSASSLKTINYTIANIFHTLVFLTLTNDQEIYAIINQSCFSLIYHIFYPLLLTIISAELSLDAPYLGGRVA
jgi:hypothetical protein